MQTVLNFVSLCPCGYCMNQQQAYFCPDKSSCRSLAGYSIAFQGFPEPLERSNVIDFEGQRKRESSLRFGWQFLSMCYDAEKEHYERK
ncbi:MAG: hypothetical protein K9H84_02030 [Bacteroidales bacterium]|nr:hypothetical protein [Bacteroidales bacterium]